MFSFTLSGSARVLRGLTIRLLVGLLLFSLFASSLAVNASASGGNVGPDGSPGWTYCADEGATCAFPGTMEVRYWGYDDNTQSTIGYRTMVATNCIDCATAAFGGADPAYGVAKRCYYRSPQLDSGEITTTAGGLNKVVTVTFSVYALQAGTTDDLKSKITVRKTSGGSYEPLGLNDTVANATSTPTSSTLEIHFENALTGADNGLKIDSGAFVDGSGQPYNQTIEINPIRFSPPVLTPDVTDNYTVNDLEIAFPDDPQWRGEITAVTNGASPLTEGTQYTVEPGKITIKAGVLGKGTHSLAVAATGYLNATVSQAVNKLYEGPQSGTGTSADPYLIATSEQLDGVRTNMGINKHYRLIADIDLSGYPNWEPIGTQNTPFYGHFDGDGHIISGLTINSGSNNVGLFGWTETTGSIKNTKLRDVNITGGAYVGGLVGNNGASIENCSVSGIVSGANYVGGLFGGSSVREISNSFSSADVSGMNSIGGLAGTFSGTLRYSYATGNVSGKDAGGLVGTSNYGEIVHSFATGNVTGINSSEIGGLVGFHYYGKISYSYASGDVNGSGNAGGLIGLNYYGEISDSYASSSVRGYYSIGGLIGHNDNSQGGEISNSYASGSVSGRDAYAYDLGGLIAKGNSSVVTNSFYDVEATGQSVSVGGIGKTTAQMKERSTYEEDGANAWDFAGRWAIDSSLNGGYPYLRDVQAFMAYDKNGSLVGSVPDSASFMPGTTVDIYSGALDLRKTGSLFGGWNTQADGEGDSYLPGDSILLASNVALYAEWNPASAAATVTSEIGTVSTGGTTNESLTNVPFVTTLAELKAAIVPASNATFEIYDADGTTVATTLATGKKVIVTAQDRISTVTYTVTMNGPLSSVATLTSSIGHASAGGTANETITNVPYGTALAAFKAAITPATNASFEIYDADGTTVATTLATGKKVIVTAQDGTTKATYTVTVNPPLSSATLTSTIGRVSAGGTANETITNVPYGTTLAAFKAAITPATGAAFEVYDADGTSIATALATGKKVIVTAQDGTTRVTYTVTVNAAPNGSGSGNGGGGGGSATPTNPLVTSTNGRLTLPAGQAGEVSLNEEIILSIPANATDKPLKITIDNITDLQKILGNNDVLISKVYEILKDFPENFKNPVTITITFDSTKLKSAETAVVYYYDEEKKSWVEVPEGKVSGNRITVKVNHFTKFAVFAAQQPPTNPKPIISLSDIAGHWAEASIKQAIASGIVTGYSDGTFKPNNTVTRAEFAVMLMNAVKRQGGETKPAFTDAAKIGAWARNAVGQAVQAGYIKGYADGTFRPNAAITRAEMATMVAHAAGLTLEANASTGFADDKDIPKWAKGAIAAINEIGYLEGKGSNRFDPNAGATRAEAVTVLLKLLANKSK